ncbi:MAG: PspA/IM30 family protein [Candidatus Competibacterales bacterium]|nr:PspA/IM30 family protein [Candidatus Competibacterales bacterium]
MALITRLSRLLRADAHAVLDRIEEPDLVLRQSLREMAQAMERAERQLEALDGEKHRTAERQQQLQEVLSRSDADLELCLDSGQEELARGLIRRRLETERALQALERRTTRLAREREQRRDALAGQRAHYEQLRQRAEAFAETPDTAERSPHDEPGPEPVSDQDIEVALLRARQARARS